MKTRPITLKPWQIQAHQRGRLGELRQVIRPQPRHDVIRIGAAWFAVDLDGPGLARRQSVIECPLGVVGDRLWARETWCPLRAGDIDPDFAVAECTEDGSAALYRVDGSISYVDATGHVSGTMAGSISSGAVDGHHADKPPKWKPPTQMPRWASRYTFEVTSIRAERLGDVEEDARAAWSEGHRCECGATCPICKGNIDVMMRQWNADHKRPEEKWRPDLWTWVAEIKEVTT